MPSQELWTDAVQHAIAAGDAVRALDWIKNCAMPLVKRGDLFTLLGWQRLFPTALMRSQPEVRLAIAWGMALAMRFDEALELRGEIERDNSADHSPDGEVVRCECEAIRSVAIALKDDSEAALSVAQDCLNRSADPWTANVASNVVRLGQLEAGRSKEILRDTVDSLLARGRQEECLRVGLLPLHSRDGRSATITHCRRRPLLS